MGNCFCEAESPCGSLEERHGLLKDDSKTSSTGDRIEVGACGPEDGEDMRRAVCEQPKKVGSGEQMRRSKDGEPNNTQGNGHLQKDSSPGKESATGAQEVEKNDATADPCTLNQLREDSSTPVSQEALAADGEEKKAEEKDDPTTAQEKASDLVSPESIPPPPEIDSTTEDDMASGSHAGSGEDAIVAEAKPSEAFTQNDEESSEPSAQEATTSAVSRETNTEAPSCSADSDADIESHVISQPPSSGSEPSGVGHAREKADSVGSAAEAKDSCLCSSTPDQEETTENGGSSPAEDTAGEAGKNVTEEDEVKFEEDKENDREKVEGALTETLAAQVEAEIQEETREEENAVLKGDDKPAAEEEDAPHDSEEDLYQGEEELAPSQKHQPQPTSELEISKVQDSCSLSPAVDILSYSEKEWKGNTAKSALIRKGYKEMSEKFSHLRRVRGDNYCALRATLFQVLSQSDQVPQWLQEEAVLMLPKILQDQDGLISHWQFPGLQTQGEGTEDPAERLKGYVEMLRKTWQAAADCPSAAERQKLCERLFQGEEEELGMLEALKLLMLGRAAELHRLMQVGEDVPLFCWLLFARDSSGCPRSFLSNHLRHVGIGAGLEQVEMFLLGYALQRTIQVYRLYKADTEEFVTFYPDDHRDDWPSVCLVTEDDRHYNVPVADAAEPSKELAGS